MRKCMLRYSETIKLVQYETFYLIYCPVFSVHYSTPVIVGDNKFVFEVNQTSLGNIQEVPKIYFNVLFPDNSRINTDGLDLSKFVLDTLRPKISDLENQSKELYKPLVQNYTDPLDPIMQQLINLESEWSNGGSKIKDILVCFQHGTDVSDQATEALANIQLLQTDTKDKMNKRVLTTSLLSKWDKEINDIHAAQSSEECKIREELLERQVGSFSDVFESCVDIEGLQDIPVALVMLRMRIDRLKIETLRKKYLEDQEEAEYKRFKEQTRSAIEEEGKARVREDIRLRDEISSLESSIQIAKDNISYLNDQIEELERKIRNHDGDIEQLTQKVDEMKSRIEKESKYIDNAFKRISKIEDNVSDIHFREYRNENPIHYGDDRDLS